MKQFDHWGGTEIDMSARPGTPEHAARMATLIQMQHNVTSPTREVRPRGIDWGNVAAWAFLAAIGWGFAAWTFAMIFGG